jgi:hypothetical protein
LAETLTVCDLGWLRITSVPRLADRDDVPVVDWLLADHAGLVHFSGGDQRLICRTLLV